MASLSSNEHNARLCNHYVQYYVIVRTDAGLPEFRFSIILFTYPLSQSISLSISQYLFLSHSLPLIHHFNFNFIHHFHSHCYSQFFLLAITRPKTDTHTVQYSIACIPTLFHLLCEGSNRHGTVLYTITKRKKKARVKTNSVHRRMLHTFDYGSYKNIVKSMFRCCKLCRKLLPS